MTQYEVYSLHCHPFTCLFFYWALCVKPTLYIIIDMRIVSSKTPLYSVDSLSLVLHSWHLAQYVNIGPPWSNLSAKIYTCIYIYIYYTVWPQKVCRKRYTTSKYSNKRGVSAITIEWSFHKCLIFVEQFYIEAIEKYLVIWSKYILMVSSQLLTELS
jgi:hypothetical protein